MRLFRRLFYFWRRRRRLPQAYKPVILVTGCSSGIGLSLARLLWRRRDYRVVITTRQKSLARLQHERFRETSRFLIRGLDVTDKAQRERLLEEIKTVWGGVDILVNNAGISYRSVVEHMTEDDEIRQLDTNYLGPIALIRLVVPQMREKGRGKIINVSSVSGMLAMPTMSSYSASKYALEGASEALWYEMKPLGINVSLVQPGFVHSNSFQHVVYSAPAARALHSESPYSDYYQSMAPFVSKMMSLSPITPDLIAKKILKVIQTEDPPLWIPATPDAIFFYYLRRFLPRRFLHNFLFLCLPGATKWGHHYSRARKLQRAHPLNDNKPLPPPRPPSE